MPVCESCLEVVAENYPGGDDVKVATDFCITMGKDIEDHLCDKRESEGEVECDCLCNK